MNNESNQREGEGAASQQVASEEGVKLEVRMRIRRRPTSSAEEPLSTTSDEEVQEYRVSEGLGNAWPVAPASSSSSSSSSSLSSSSSAAPLSQLAVSLAKLRSQTNALLSQLIAAHDHSSRITSRTINRILETHSLAGIDDLHQDDDDDDDEDQAEDPEL
ncbi:hypothetical protein PCANC_13141 [Puccinia coronata f. sp. avenae]|uniref:Uncharacterized protein n=1 Tax=Puccinia coronata f. sp. avenae TaxID=200324 RepID=A0A2N5RZW0_9BASI|nr:hypothetical protein PCASD_25693 [Puccinia coronata f. sp. avenae]PLW42045.1 hypothetical protein PCANC_13141 [Puccinia coronata f. sp. avenae]